MGRTKKDVAVAAEAEGTVDLIPPVEAGDEVKKAAGRGKRKGKEVATSENSPPKRTLRSNSKTSLVVAPVEKEVVAEEKKGRKAPAKSKKVEEVNTDSDASDNTDAPAVNGNGLLKSKAENGVASVEDVQVDKAAPEKGAKGRKKNEKTASAVNGETLKETEKKETKQTDDSETQKSDNADKEKSKPVKANNAKGKKKGESKTVQADSEEVTSEPEAAVNDKEEEAKEKEKAASGKGKKKAEKKEEEVVAPKKTKKEAPAKPAKAAKDAETEETKEEKETKPVAGETKKAAGKSKSAKAKEVAIEH